MNLSAIVLSKNEEKNIQRCLESLAFCDEILVIDDYSTDKTVSIAAKLGVRIYKRKLNSDFAAQRNFAVGKALSKWIFFVDADEVVSNELADEVIKIVHNSYTSVKGYFIRRHDFIFNTKIAYGEIGNVRLLRLARKGAGEWRRKVHEVWDIRGKVGKLDNPLQHYPHQTLREFIYDVNTMSTLHAQENLREGKKASLIKIIILPIGKFIDAWIVKLGFLDKTPGVVIALMMSLHSFLAWSKLWVLQKKNQYS